MAVKKAITLDDEHCPQCGGAIIQKPITGVCRCGFCGKEWVTGQRIAQRPIGRIDLLGGGRKQGGTPFRW